MFLHERPYRPQRRGRRTQIVGDGGFRQLMLVARRTARASKRPRGRARVAVSSLGAGQRRVVLKARYVPMTHASASRAAEKHLDYVQRDGVDRDGGAGILYGVEAPETLFEKPAQALGGRTAHGASERPLSAAPEVGGDRQRVAQEPDLSPTERLRQSMLRPIPGEKHQFRIIVSAEDAAQLDLTDFITRVMERVEKDLGQPLIWAAANHHDTDDPHTHLIIRGVDRNGEVVRFDREYISRIWRERAQEIVTQELGPRSEQEIERQLQREVERGRYTSLDRSIAARALDGVVRATDLANPYQRARLSVLQAMGLAEQLDAIHWQLQEGWQAKLKADGERGDIIKQMYKALGDRIDTGRYRIVKRFEQLHGEQEVTGRVTALGLMDSTPGALYAVVESTSGQGYYVPLWQSEVAELKRGDLVTLKQLNDSWLKPIDRPLAELGRDKVPVTPERVVEHMRARLEELARAGLATRSERGVAGSAKARESGATRSACPDDCAVRRRREAGDQAAVG